MKYKNYIEIQRLLQKKSKEKTKRQAANVEVCVWKNP